MSEFNIQISDEALSQLRLIKENDFTVAGKVLRLSIGGKGCDGFTYQLGFTHSTENDVTVDLGNLILHLDPLVATYCKEGHIEYFFDFETDTDGFAFINKNQHKYKGKFFKDESMQPNIG